MWHGMGLRRRVPSFAVELIHLFLRKALKSTKFENFLKISMSMLEETLFLKCLLFVLAC